MTQSDGTQLRAVLQEALKKDQDFFKEVLQVTLQDFLEFERDDQIGVSKNARDENRLGTRNGYKKRGLYTRLCRC